MQATSDKYKRIIADDTHWFDTSLTVGGSGVLVDRDGYTITFGGDNILVDNGGPDTGFREDNLFSVNTTQEFFKNGMPEVGSAVSAEIDVSMIAPYGLEKQARLALYIRAANNTEVSEWIQQGIFYIDTREQSHDDRGFDVLDIHGYDAMMFAETTYPSDNANNYPMLDRTMVKLIADSMKPEASKSGVPVDPRTWEIMTRGYRFNLPVAYSKREVLCMIAAAYGGNFIISPTGELRLVKLGDLPPETRVLITDDGYQITFGGTKILV